MAVGDPGVFVCGPDDIAPWERGAGVPTTARPARPVAAAPAPRAWLVLALCPRCVARTGRYCSEHGPGNWWLTNWGGARGGKAA